MDRISNIIRHTLSVLTRHSIINSVFRWQVGSSFFPFSASDLLWLLITGPGIGMIPWSLFFFISSCWNLWASTKPRLHLKFQCRYLCHVRSTYFSISLFWIPIPSDSGKYSRLFGVKYTTRIYDGRNEDWRSVSFEISSTSKHISSFRTLKTEKLCSRRRTITRLWLLFCSSDGLPAKLIGS